MKRLSFASMAAGAAMVTLLACGGIVDPTLKGDRVATISGALTGAIPAGAHVALVWRKGEAGGLEIGEDVPVVDGKFTMTLPIPDPSYFFAASLDESSSSAGLPGKVPPPSTTEPAPAPPSTSGSPGSSSGGSGGGSSSGGGKYARIHTLGGNQLGGTINEVLSVAAAGFVVYVDANNNGKLDLEGQYASSPDTILGGNDELLLAFLKGGGTLDYEKLRDKSGILPQAGYNLFWKGNRWLSLDTAELVLSSKEKLPDGVCASTATSEDPTEPNGSSTSSSGGGGATDAGTTDAGTYPSPTDPNLHCSADGRSFSVTLPSNCPTPPPPPVGLCAPNYGEVAIACSGGGWGTSLQPGEDPPDGWPCFVGVKDAGVDAAKDGGAADGGAADGGN